MTDNIRGHLMRGGSRAAPGLAEAELRGEVFVVSCPSAIQSVPKTRQPCLRTAGCLCAAVGRAGELPKTVGSRLIWAAPFSLDRGRA